MDDHRLQDKALASTYNGPIDVVRQVVRKEGILGLYAGMEATFWRYVALPYVGAGEALLRLLDFGIGTFGGTAATSGLSSRSRRCFQNRRSVTVLPYAVHGS
jgi:hypothetical protein